MIRGRKDVIHYINEQTGVSKSDIDLVLRAFQKCIIHCLSNYGMFRMNGLFSMQKVVYKARTVNSVRTNERVITPERNRVRVKLSKNIRASVEDDKIR